ncbi:MAG: alcohol dehydrogenase catalytic domain-containing protein [Anaerolineae bacterium]|nr:alcohol dehydrogenase catalytic domain-containing protein [Anaerolineae bacterium]
MQQAAFYERNKTIRVGECVPVPPTSGEVQVQVAYGGICGTDLHIYHGAMDWRVAESQIMGHEISGTISAVGAGVTGFSLGDRVTVMPLDPCGECPACLAGHSHICHNLKFLGIDTPGGFQSYWTVPAHTILPLPAHLSLTYGAMIEPLAVACHDVRLGEVERDEFVVVLGGGPIGALIGFVAQNKGARVVVSEINPFRVDLLGRLGLETINPQKTDLVKLVEERTDQAGADVVFEVTAHPAGAEMMTKLPRTRGRIVIVGIFSKSPQVDLFRFFWRELKLRGARVYEKVDFEQAIQLADSGSIPLDGLISATYPLTKLQDGLQQMEKGGEIMKILISCSEN